MKLFAALVLGWLLCVSVATAGPSQQTNGESQSAEQAPPDKTSPSYDMKAQALLDLQDMQNKFTRLAQAVPAEKYAWRPSQGVRSFGELLLHTSAAGFNFPTMKGTPPAPGFVAKGFEQSTTDKAQIIEWLNKSFAYSMASIQSMTNAEFATPLPKFGPEANAGDIVYLLVSHQHEQLGAAIVYARSNGITPPWTADALKKKAAQQNPRANP